MNTIENIKKLREEFTGKEDRDTLKDWESQAKLNEELSKLKNNFAIKELLENAKTLVESIDIQLSTDIELMNDKGKLLFEKKIMFRTLISTFEDAEKNSKEIARLVKEKL